MRESYLSIEGKCADTIELEGSDEDWPDMNLLLSPVVSYTKKFNLSPLPSINQNVKAAEQGAFESHSRIPSQSTQSINDSEIILTPKLK